MRGAAAIRCFAAVLMHYCRVCVCPIQVGTGGAVAFPSSLGTALAGGSSDAAPVDVHAKDWTVNPYAWSPSAATVTSPVFSVSLVSTDGVEIPVSHEVHISSTDSWGYHAPCCRGSGDVFLGACFACWSLGLSDVYACCV